MRVSGKHNDLDNVGPSLRHHTFFEMLGNFSFGDFLLQGRRDPLRLDDADRGLEDAGGPAGRLSIFKGENGIPRDAEAYDLWRTLVPADRILELGAGRSNFWQNGRDRVVRAAVRKSTSVLMRGTAGNDPEIEIWNNVFMEFDRGADGTLTRCPQRPPSTLGMGLERVTAVLQDRCRRTTTPTSSAPLLAPHRRQRQPAITLRARRATTRNTDVLDARGRRIPHSRADDVPDRGRSDPVQRMARLRPAQDHATGDAARQAPGPAPSRSAPAGRRPRARNGRPRIRKSVTNRAMIEKRTILAEEGTALLVPGHAHQRRPSPRLEAELAEGDWHQKHKVLSRAMPPSASTTPSARARSTSARGHGSGDAGRATVDRACAYDRAMEGQRDKARAGSTFGGSKKGEDFALGADASTEPLAAAGDRFSEATP